MARHQHFEELATQLIGNTRISRPLLAEVLSRVAVTTPPEVTRAQIASGEMLRVELPLSEASVSKAVTALLHCELLEEEISEEPADGPRVGRPPMLVRLGRDRWFSIGVHVHLDDGLPATVYAVAASLDDHVIVSKELPVETESDASSWPSEALVDAIVRVVDLLVEDERLKAREANGWLPLLGVGVEIGRHVHEGQVVVREGEALVPYDLRDALGSALRLPVVVENDANALAVRESYGKYVRHDFALVLVVDEGVGAALAVDGRVYRGRGGMAGEIGHLEVPTQDLPNGVACLNGFGEPCWCGRLRHVNVYATPQRIRAALGVADLSEIELARAEDTERVFTAAGASLGHALAALVNIINPGQLLVILPKEFDSPSGRRYLDEINKALHSTFSTGNRDAQLVERYLDGAELATAGARAAAIRVLIEFIDHLSGIDRCLPAERTFATWLARGAAAVVGGALGRPLGTAATSAAQARRAIVEHVRGRAPVGERAQATRAPWRR